MFPTRTLALIVALTLSTSVPLTACAQAAPAPEAAPQAAHTYDAAGCWYFAEGPAWVSDTGDGLCHAGEHAAQATGWEAEGYDGTDASLAQYAYDHGQMIEGYGVDVSKVYDTSKPYGWKVDPRQDGTGYTGYCGDAALAEAEYIEDADFLSAGKRCAAELILLRERSGQRMEEDWTWAGAPAAVLEFNDALIDDWHATGAHEAYHAWPAPMGPQVRQFLGRVALVDSAL